MYCSYNVVAKGGNLSVKVSKAFKKNSPRDASGISCDNMFVCGGKVSASVSNAISASSYADSIYCSGLTESKGSLTVKAMGKKESKSRGVSSGTVKVTGGTLNVSSSSSKRCRGIDTDKYTQKGGKVIVRVAGQSTADAYGMECNSVLKVSKGSLKVNASSSKRGYASGISWYKSKKIAEGTTTVTVNGEKVKP